MKQFFLFLGCLAAVFLTAQAQQTTECMPNTNTVYKGIKVTNSTSISLFMESEHLCSVSSARGDDVRIWRADKDAEHWIEIYPKSCFSCSNFNDGVIPGFKFNVNNKFNRINNK
jgi:hypothetical protein